MTLPQQLEPFVGEEGDGDGDGDGGGDGGDGGGGIASTSPVAVALRNSKLPVVAVFDGIGEGEMLSVGVRAKINKENAFLTENLLARGH